MPARIRLNPAHNSLRGGAAAIVAAASMVSLCCGAAMAQAPSASAQASAAPVAVSAQASAAPAAPAPAAQPAAPQPAVVPAEAAPASTGSTAPAVAAREGDKPAQRPARQVQGPRREPIKEPVSSIGCRAARAPGKPYFVEFRSRTAVSFGHTFVFHGRLGEGNRFASFQVAGLHPKGDDPNTYMRGMMVPVESETGPSWGDLDEQYLTGRFCVTLTEAEYRKAVAYIKHLQATKKTWHATTYNCNAFAADIARHIGLDAPNPNMYLPETFIKRLADLNPRGRPNNPFAVNFQQPAPQATAPAAQQQRRTQGQRTAQPAQRPWWQQPMQQQ
jgi:hypothetical protein